VYLEVFVDDRWALLDATQGKLQTEYEARARILPPSRFAYDKGGDPYALVLSPRWELWKEQTRRTFRDFDLARIPVAEGLPLRGCVFVAGNNPEWGWVMQRCRALGFQGGESGNCAFEKWMPKSKGGLLVVTSLAGKTVLPAAYQRLLPAEALQSAAATKPSGVVSQSADDGTRVVVVFGRDADSLHGEIDRLAIEK
jgi:hypothetical protein